MSDKLKFEQEKLFDKNVTSINDFSLFAPKSSRSIKEDYPELREAEEFKNLTKSDMLFVWYYACRSSPLWNTESDQKRAEVAIEYIRRIDPDMITGKFKDYAMLQFNHKIETAIAKMRSYKPETRIRAKKMVDKMLENYEKIISIDVDSAEFLKDGERDFTKIKQYVDSSKTITNNLPTLIEQAEKGFSIVEKGSDEDEEEGFGMLDEYFEEEH